MNSYAASIMAIKPTRFGQTISHTVIVFQADNEQAAHKHALHICKQKYSEEEGYQLHDVSLVGIHIVQRPSNG